MKPTYFILIVLIISLFLVSNANCRTERRGIRYRKKRFGREEDKDTVVEVEEDNLAETGGNVDWGRSNGRRKRFKRGKKSQFFPTRRSGKVEETDVKSDELENEKKIEPIPNTPVDLETKASSRRSHRLSNRRKKMKKPSHSNIPLDEAGKGKKKTASIFEKKENSHSPTYSKKKRIPKREKRSSARTPPQPSEKKYQRKRQMKKQQKKESFFEEEVPMKKNYRNKNRLSKKRTSTKQKRNLKKRGNHNNNQKKVIPSDEDIDFEGKAGSVGMIIVYIVAAVLSILFCFGLCICTVGLCLIYVKARKSGKRLHFGKRIGDNGKIDKKYKSMRKELAAKVSIKPKANEPLYQKLN